VLTRRAWALLFILAAAAAAAVVFVLFIVPAPLEEPGEALPWLLFPLAFALAEIATAHLVIRNQAITFSLSGIPLVVGFYFLSPSDLMVALVIGAGIALLGRRRPLLGLVADLAITALAGSLAILVFVATATPGATSLFAWSVTSFLAAATLTTVSALADWVLRSLEGRDPARASLSLALAIGLVAALANASVALVMVVFLRTEADELWLLIVPTAIALVGYRAFSALRARQASLQFLHECSQLLQGASLDDGTLASVLRRTQEAYRAISVEAVLGGVPDDRAATRVVVDAAGRARVEPAPTDLVTDRRATLGPGSGGRVVQAPSTSRSWRSSGVETAIVPVRGAGAVYGTLAVARHLDGLPAFGTDDVRALETLATRIGLVAENSDLLERLSASIADSTHLATIVETSDAAIAAIDAEGRITAWNAEAEHMFGYSAERMLGQIAADVLTEGERDRLREVFAAAFAGTVVRNARMDWVRADGTRIPVSFAVTPMTGPGGVVAGVSAVARDESDRARTEAALEASSELLKTVIDGSPLGMGVAGADHRWVQANPALGALLAMDAREVVGRSVLEMIHPDDRGTVRDLEERMFDGVPSVLSVERRYVDRSGRAVWTNVTARVVTEPSSGNPVALYVIEDITARRRAEQQARSMEEQFRSAALAISAAQEPRAVLRAVLDAAREILQVECAAIGIEPDGDGSTASGDGAGLDPQALLQRIGPVSAEGGIVGMAAALGRPVRLHDLEANSPGGVSGAGEPRLRSFIAVPIVHDGVGDATLHLANKIDADDFSEDDEAIAVALATHAAVCLENARINARAGELVRDLDRANLDLVEASEAKSRFLASVAHELRTPLHAILMAGELVHDPPAGPLPESQVRDLGATIESSGRHMVHLIDDLVDLSRIEAGRLDLRPTRIPLRQVVAEIAPGLTRTAESQGITLDLPPESDMTVFADPVRLRQILTNLIANALKFTGSGGRVSLEVRQAEGLTHIAVRDTGIGIAPEDLDRAFLPFEQVSRMSTPGAGLGLAISRSLAELHDGRLEATSQPGVGSVFTLTLPDGPAATVAGRPWPHSLAPFAGIGHGRPILVVEDNPAAMDLATKVLRIAGYDVWQSTGLVAANELLDRATPALVLLDLRLGDGNGLDLVARVRSDAKHHDLPILVMSADAMSDDIARARAAGCNDFLPKPVTPSILLAHVHELLAVVAEAS
jgi:PAS domain S-box-containing protein